MMTDCFAEGQYKADPAKTAENIARLGEMLAEYKEANQSWLRTE